jgi:AcrR family transcriptional regulator
VPWHSAREPDKTKYTTQSAASRKNSQAFSCLNKFNDGVVSHIFEFVRARLLAMTDRSVINLPMTALRWQRRKDERTSEILRAAVACFSEKGFAPTRMEDIAARAGITKGTIYLYFESKAALFKALARQEVGARLGETAGELENFDGSSAELLHMVLSNLGHLVRTSDSVVLLKVVLAEMGQFPELAEFWRHEIIDRGLALFESIIRRGIARGEFQDIPPEHAARLCVAPMLIIAFWRTVFSRFDRIPYDYQALIDAHIEVLLRGLSIDAPPPVQRERK